MARGFESKSVADQQDAVDPVRAPHGETEGEPAVLLRRKRLELARVDVLKHLERATAEPHREMLNRALAALDDELKTL
jgi:hypothetical protein